MKMFKKRVPLVFQIEAAECGAASLCMILGYYGRHIPLSEMRKDCHISRDGSRMSYLMAAARAHGMQPDAYRADPGLTGRKLPLIAFWNYSHFLVVEEITEKWVYLADPASGRRKITRDEFAKSFSGVVLELRPTESFERAGRPENLFADVLKEFRLGGGAVFYLVLLFFMINCIGLILPAFSTLFVDYYLPYLENVRVTYYFLVFLLVIALEGLLLGLRRHVNIRFQRIQSADMTGGIMKKLLRLPVSYFSTRSHAVIDAHLNDIDSLTDFLSARLVPLVLDLFFSLAYAGLLFVYSPRVALPTVLLIAAIVLLIDVLLRLSRSAIVLAVNRQNEFYSSVVQNVRLFDTIKSVALEEESVLSSMRSFSAFKNAEQRSKKLLCILQAIPVAVPLAIQVFVIALGANEILQGRLTIGKVLACQSIAMSIFTPIVQTIAEFSGLQGQEIRVKALKDIVNEADDPGFRREHAPDLPETLTLTASLPEGERDASLSPSGLVALELRNVAFGYNTALPPVVEDISFRVQPGGSLALVGSSGSGKSTILKLLEGLYVPLKGQILFGGIPMENINRTSLTRHMAVVSQSPFLFTGTVRENITLFDRSIDMDAVTLAAKEACVFDAIEAHRDGFNAIISPSGTEFSGGEIQRIMIARALVKNPSILILDEATSALDTLVEKAIMENIRARAITLIVVAHRLSAIRDCGEILVLDQGKIAQRGKHEELASRGGIYQKLMASEESDES